MRKEGNSSIETVLREGWSSMNDNELEATPWLEQSKHDAKAADINRREKLKHIMKLVTELMTKGS